MVYELRCYTLMPGKMPEYLKAAETIGRPARGNNYGVNHGYWTAEFGALNQIWHLWKYDSFDERTRLRGELAKNKDWTEKYVPIIRPLIQRQDLRADEPGGRHQAGRRHDRQRLRAAHLSLPSWAARSSTARTSRRSRPRARSTRRSGAPGPASSRSPTSGSICGATRTCRSASRRARDAMKDPGVAGLSRQGPGQAAPRCTRPC